MATETRNSSFRILRKIEKPDVEIASDGNEMWEIVGVIEAKSPGAALLKAAEQDGQQPGVYVAVVDRSWHQKEMRARSGFDLI